MTNLTKISLGNWTKQVVSIGGTGNLTLGAVLQHPTCAETVGTGVSFHYVIRAANNTPIEAGIGTMIDAITLRRDRVYNKMVDNVYTSVDYANTDTTLSNTDIPEGAFVFTAPTEEMLYDMMREQPEIDYGDVSGAIGVNCHYNSIKLNLTGDTSLSLLGYSLPPGGTYHEFLVKVTTEYNPGITSPFQAGYQLTLTGLNFTLDDGNTFFPPIRLMGDRELVLRFIRTNNGYRVENLSLFNHTQNIGVVSGNVSVDIRYPRQVASLAGAVNLVTINAVSPSVQSLVPSRYTLINDSAITKVVRINTSVFTIVDAPFSDITLLAGDRIDFEIERDFADETGKYSIALLNDYNYRDYGNVSGIVDISFQYASCEFNLTGDTTLNVVDSTIAPVLGNHEVLFKITSSNDPAVTDPFNMGYTITLSGTDFTIDGSTPFPPLQIGGDGAETLLRLTNIGNTNKYRVQNLSKYQLPQNIGVIGGLVTLDIRYPFSIGELVGSDNSVTIEDISPIVPVLEPAHFTIVNNGSVTKTVTWDAGLFSITGSTLNQVTIPVGYKVDFDVRRNPLNSSVSYEVKVGDVNYNQSASGLATTWNPSDSLANTDLSNSNKTAKSISAASMSASRTFGAKNTGKWRYAIRCDANMVLGVSGGRFAFGLADLSTPLTTEVGSSPLSYALRWARISAANSQQKVNNSIGTNIGTLATPIIADVLGVCVDLDTGKVWFTKNGSVLGGGDPESGLSQDFTIASSAYMLPMITIGVQTSLNLSGIWTILNELEDPYATTWPSFSNWTA